MDLHDIVIVLARPEEPGNVGAVCRAMKNMGLSRLRIVSPNYGEHKYRNPEAVETAIRGRAVHAEDVWEAALTFDSLAAAIADCSLAIGTTRRRGQYRKQTSMPVEELGAFLRDRSGSAALVFGNERSGLDDAEITLCNMASHIQSSEDCPSLNLSHAVQIYAWELWKTLTHAKNEGEPKGLWVPLDETQINALTGRITASLERVGFYKIRGREEQETFFHDLFARAGLTEKEGRYFERIIAKAVRLGGEEEDLCCP
jgi:tRNA/rRNA methyltransferase/tRNA (cytidine32/uridine32-2'-O)-methyltransferase